MRWRRFFKQLEFVFEPIAAPPRAIVCRRDHALETQARELLRSLDAAKLAREIRVKWNPRLKTAAGRADYREKLISLNPLLQNMDGIALNQNESNHGKLDRNFRSSVTSAMETEVSAVARGEVDRTLRHELAHLLAQWRVGRRRIAPHGVEWRAACRDLGIADEARCHDLPFATEVYAPRYVYRCPNCNEEFPRVRKIRRAIACLACCRKHNGGNFDPRFQLKLEGHAPSCPEIIGRDSARPSNLSCRVIETSLDVSVVNERIQNRNS